MSNFDKIPKRNSFNTYPPMNAPEIPITLDVHFLMDVHSVQSSSYRCERMMEYITTFLKTQKGVTIQVDGYGNIYATKGKAESYPAIVSHTDTVHTIHNDFNVLRDEDIIWAHSHNRQVGVGGDDKVGVFMCLSMLMQLPKIKVAFFKDEEVGCIGSGRANMAFFEDCGFVLQCDRKGSDDFIYNAGRELYGANFEKAVAPFLATHGYKEATGMMTDVLELKSNGLAVACANMSCGYYSPHSDNEVLSLKAVQKCYNLVSDIMTTFIDDRFPHDVKHSKGGYSYSYSGYGYGGRNHNGEFHERTSYKSGNSRSTNINDNDLYVNGGNSDVPINKDDILRSWGLSEHENEYYENICNCKDCKEILDEDVDGIKYCHHCNSYKHIPDIYLR